MAEAADIDDVVEKKSSKLPILVGLLLAILGGGGGFFAVSNGMLFGDPEVAEEEPELPTPTAPEVAFVPMDPMLITLPPGSAARYLRFVAQLEVEKDAVDEVTTLLPRVVDVLNDYLRLVTVAQLEDPAHLMLLRAQILRRVQIVVGDGLVRDVLIMEFVLD